MPKNKRIRRNIGRRARWIPRTSGRMILNTAFTDNVEQYTTINIVANSVQLLTDRPHRQVRVWIEYSMVPDASAPKTAAHNPMFGMEIITSDSSAEGRVIYHMAPTMIPLGVVKRLSIKVPYSPPFVAKSNTTLARFTCSGSPGLAVTINFFVEVVYSWPNYAGVTVGERVITAPQRSVFSPASYP